MIYGLKADLVTVWIPNGIFAVVSFWFLKKYYEIAGLSMEFAIYYVHLGIAGILSSI